MGESLRSRLEQSVLHLLQEKERTTFPLYLSKIVLLQMVKEIIMRKKTYASPVIAVYSFCEETPLMNMSPGIGQHNPGKRKPGPQAGNTRSEGWGSDESSLLWED